MNELEEIIEDLQSEDGIVVANLQTLQGGPLSLRVDGDIATSLDGRLRICIRLDEDNVWHRSVIALGGEPVELPAWKKAILKFLKL